MDVKKSNTDIIKVYLNALEILTDDEFANLTNQELSLNLTSTGITPNEIINFLEEYGYQEVCRKNNGWNLDFWISFAKKEKIKYPSGCQNMVICGNGLSFELKLCIDGLEY